MAGPYVLGFVALIFLDFIRRLRRWHRLRHIPGPPLAGWTSFALTKPYLDGTIYEHWKELAEKYGGLVRVGPNEVMCTDVEHLYRISSARSEYTKGEWYKIGQITPGKDTILTMQSKEQRRERKRKLMPGYMGKGIDGFNLEDGIDRGIQSWISLIDRKYASADPAGFVPLDLGPQAHYFALDALGEVAYSTPLGYLANDRDVHGVLEVNDAMLPVMHVFSKWLFIFRILRTWPFSYLLPRDGDSNGFGAIMGYTSQLVDKRLGSYANGGGGDAGKKEQHADILQSFIKEGLGRDELKEEVTLQFFVGTDTIASAIRMTLLFLSMNPQAYHKLQSEIDDALRTGRATSTPTRPIRDAEAKALPYLQACILESLRIWPPAAAASFYKVVPRGGDTVCGHFLPAGTAVSTGANYAVNRNKKFWGPDADVYRPERWIEAAAEDEARMQAMMRTFDLSFGHGQFVCAGKQLAMMQLSKVIPELIRRYNITSVNPAKPLKIMGYVGWLAHDVFVKVEKRPEFVEEEERKKAEHGDILLSEKRDHLS